MDNFNQTTFSFLTPFMGKIDSQQLNGYIESSVNDLQSISIILNQIVDLINTLNNNPSVLDGTSILVDNEASEIKDNGVFYFEHPTDSEQNRPATLYETLLLFLQLIANNTNGLREGVKVGAYSSKVAISNGAYVEYDWPYIDYMFEYKLYGEATDTVSKLDSSDITVTVDISDKKIKITNVSGGTLNIWGYLWHPVFNI